MQLEQQKTKKSEKSDYKPEIQLLSNFNSTFALFRYKVVINNICCQQSMAGSRKRSSIQHDNLARTCYRLVSMKTEKMLDHSPFHIEFRAEISNKTSAKENGYAHKNVRKDIILHRSSSLVLYTLPIIKEYFDFTTSRSVIFKY